MNCRKGAGTKAAERTEAESDKATKRRDRKESRPNSGMKAEEMRGGMVKNKDLERRAPGGEPETRKGCGRE